MEGKLIIPVLVNGNPIKILLNLGATQNIILKYFAKEIKVSLIKKTLLYYIIGFGKNIKPQ